MAKIAYVEFEADTGKVLRRGVCQAQHLPRPRLGNGVATQSRGCHPVVIECDGLAADGRAVNPRAVLRSKDRDRVQQRPARVPRRKLDID